MDIFVVKLMNIFISDGLNLILDLREETREKIWDYIER